MGEHRDMAARALRRLLANGPLTALPKRPVDQQLLVALAASGSTYRLNLERIEEVEAVRGIDAADLLSQVRDERDRRKRRHAT